MAELKPVDSCENFTKITQARSVPRDINWKKVKKIRLEAVSDPSKKITLWDYVKDEKTIVIFLRSLNCLACIQALSYYHSIAPHIKNSAKPLRTIFICNSPAKAVLGFLSEFGKWYEKISGRTTQEFEAELLINRDLSLYNAFNLKKSAYETIYKAVATPPPIFKTKTFGEAREILDSTMNKYNLSIKKTLLGNWRQLGGAFIVGPEERMSFGHREEFLFDTNFDSEEFTKAATGSPVYVKFQTGLRAFINSKKENADVIEEEEEEEEG